MSLRSLSPEPIRAAVRPIRAAMRRMRGDVKLREWPNRGFDMPAPNTVKWAVLHRYGHPTDTWIETGTYLGDTTAFLARAARMVYSIEPGPSLASDARDRFRDIKNVTIVEGLSENVLDGLMKSVKGPLSLWLDGHYSAGNTYQGPLDTPIRQELGIVEANLSQFPKITVLVDDVRCFEPNHPACAGYPTRSYLVDWADRNSLTWAIEHDIFVATRTEA